MHQGRLRLRPWLEEQIRSGKYPGVVWLDEMAGVFQIPWKHAARHGWNIDKDATLFRNWAMHTGRYKPGIDKPDPKTWKANFRCALNSLPDVKELHDRSIKKGNNAFRVYMMLPSIKISKRRKELRDFDTDIKCAESGLGSLSESVQSGICPPLEQFTETFCRYRVGDAGYSSGLLYNRDPDPSSTTTKGPQDCSVTQWPFLSEHVHSAGNTECPANGNEHAQAVLKIVDHLKTIEHWNQSHDSNRTWTGFYSEGTDYCGHSLQNDFHTYSGLPRPFSPITNKQAAPQLYNSCTAKDYGCCS